MTGDKAGKGGEVIYLLEKIWIDPMENTHAYGYMPFAYADTEMEAKSVCASGRDYTAKDCWALEYAGAMPQYRYTEIDNIKEIRLERGKA